MAESSTPRKKLPTNTGSPKPPLSSSTSPRLVAISDHRKRRVSERSISGVEGRGEERRKEGRRYLCWNNNTRRFSKSREGRQKAMACKLAIFLPDSETPRNVNSRRGGAVLRGIKINLAAFPGNSQTQILTSPITFFSRSSPRHLSLSKVSLDVVDFVQRNRSPPSPSRGEILARKHEGHIVADLPFSSRRRRTRRSCARLSFLSSLRSISPSSIRK